MEASQTRDYCVAKNATHRAARSDPSQRKSALLRMTMDWVLSCWPIGISSPASDGLDQAERHQAEPEIDDEAQIDLEGYVSRSWRQMLQQ
jgi:hypothetical protein